MAKLPNGKQANQYTGYPQSVRPREHAKRAAEVMAKGLEKELKNGYQSAVLDVVGTTPKGSSDSEVCMCALCEAQKLAKSIRSGPARKLSSVPRLCSADDAGESKVVDNIILSIDGSRIDNREGLAGALFWILKNAGWSVDINSDARVLPEESATLRYQMLNKNVVGIKIKVRRT